MNSWVIMSWIKYNYKNSQWGALYLCVQVKTAVADLQFLFCDIGLVTLIAIVMGRGGPSNELHHCRPPASLLALPVLGCLFIHTCTVILGQLAALFITTSQDWSVDFVSCPKENPNDVRFMEQFVLKLCSLCAPVQVHSSQFNRVWSRQSAQYGEHWCVCLVRFPVHHHGCCCDEGLPSQETSLP